MSVIRVGSVGIGGISRGVHLPGIEKSPDLQLVAVCDIDPTLCAMPVRLMVSMKPTVLPIITT